MKGRLIPISKLKTKEIPKIDKIRPIVALSPIMKIIESRLINSIKKYAEEILHVAQKGFKANSETAININGMINELKNEVDVFLFFDFKEAYDNINLELLFEKLKEKKVISQEEINTLIFCTKE